MAENKSRYRRAVEYLQKPSQRDVQGKKSLTFNQTTGLDGTVFGYNTGSGFIPEKMLKEIGDGTGNSAVVSCLNVLATSFAEPRIKVMKYNKGDVEVLENHPVQELMARPNPYTSGSLLAHYIITALNAEGDAYLFKNRSKNGRVVELIPLIPMYVKPRGNEKQLITHYEYYVKDSNKVDGNEFKVIPAQDIVHIRQGVDPNNHRKGFAPLKAVLREILGDEAAGQYAAALLHNMAVPGVILSPKDDSMGGPSQEEAEAIAQIYKQKFGGSNRGAPMILSGSMDVKVVSWSPEQLNLNQLRRLPEERVSAVLGVPAILAGLGAGLEAATYNNTRELREFFTEQKLIPLWQTVANEITHQLLLSDFTSDKTVHCKYDLDEVRALDVDKGEQYKRMQTGVSGGWITVAEARKAVGLDVGPEHDVFLRPLNLEPTPPKDYQDFINTDVVEEPQEEPQEEAEKAAMDEDIFDNSADALARSEELSCAIGVHTHEVNGKEVFMPCQTHEDYEAAIAKSYYEDVEEKVSEKVKKALKKKVDDFNAKDPKYRATLRMLTAVFRRGVGAYNTNPSSVRPSVTSSDQWAYARVNAFLKGLKGKFPSKPFDTDLLPSGHPLSSKKSAKGKYDDMNFTIPSGAKKEARRGLDWVKEHGRGGTSVGRNSARYLLNNTTAGPEKVRHIAKYFPRHEVDKQAEGWRPGEKGYPSNGRIAWALWGGETGKTWSAKLVRGMNSRDGKKDTLTTESFQVEVTREGNIVPTPTRLDRQNNKKEDTSVHKEENEHLED
tara:strand:+ start:4457 stop:6793 length:2337 start_codon:yes stop_codon:yes gene_type:complete